MRRSKTARFCKGPPKGFRRKPGWGLKRKVITFRPPVPLGNALEVRAMEREMTMNNLLIEIVGKAMGKERDYLVL